MLDYSLQSATRIYTLVITLELVSRNNVSVRETKIVVLNKGEEEKFEKSKERKNVSKSSAWYNYC